MRKFLGVFTIQSTFEWLSLKLCWGAGAVSLFRGSMLSSLLWLFFRKYRSSNKKKQMLLNLKNNCVVFIFQAQKIIHRWMTGQYYKTNRRRMSFLFIKSIFINWSIDHRKMSFFLASVDLSTNKLKIDQHAFSLDLFTPAYFGTN